MNLQVVQRRVTLHGKERSFFQILNESSSVKNAYLSLAGEPCEDCGLAAYRSGLEQELIKVRVQLNLARVGKHRSEPLGVDKCGRQFWIVRSDPEHIFTQVTFEKN